MNDLAKVVIKWSHFLVLSISFLKLKCKTFCSLIGAVIIITGFYAVMWGRAKEQNTIHDSGVRSSESSGEKLPLLQNSAEE